MKYKGPRLAMLLALAMQQTSLPVTAEENEINSDGSVSLEGITVYGEKQEKDLQEIPTSVGVVSSYEIESSTIQEFNDVYNRLANVSALRGGNESLFTVRGISVQGLSDNPNNFTAGVYVDDVALDNLSIRYGAMSIWDIEQVEFYRGPQGTLQGRSALNGALHLKTVEPSYERDVKARAIYGSHDTQRLSVAGGTAIVDDELAFRVSIDDYRSDGYAKNITRNEDDYAGFDRQTKRAKLLWEPKGLDKLRVLLSHSRTKNNMGDNPNVRLDDPFSFEAQSDSDAFHNIQTDLSSVKLAWEHSDQLTFHSITSYTEDQYTRLDDYDSTADPSGVIDQNGSSKGMAQEFRINFNNDIWSGVAGVYAHRNERNAYWDLGTKFPKAGVKQQAFFALMAPPEQGGFGLDETTANAIWSVVPDLLDIEQLFDSGYETQNTAIFGEATARVNDKWAFTVGVRYDRENQDRNQSTRTQVLTQTGEPNSQALVDALEAQLQSDSEEIETDYDAILPKLAAQYFWSEDINIGLMLQKGYRAGGSSVNLSSQNVVAFDPEYTWNYELAFRSRVLDGNATLNANLFYTDWKDQQVDVSPSGDRLDKHTGNAGESKLYGAEIETRGFLTGNLEAFVSAGYVKTEYKSFTLQSGGTLQDFKGNEFMGAPNITTAIGFNYFAGEGFIYSIDANYQDEAFLDNANTRTSDERTLVNAKVTYEEATWAASFWASNLMDKDYIIESYQQDLTPGVSVQDYATPGAPRTLGVSVSIDL